MNNSGNVAEVSLELKLKKTSGAKYEGTIGSFKRMDKRSIPEQSVRRGVQSIGNRSSLGWWLVTTHKAKSK